MQRGQRWNTLHWEAFSLPRPFSSISYSNFRAFWQEAAFSMAGSFRAMRAAFGWPASPEKTFCVCKATVPCHAPKGYEGRKGKPAGTCSIIEGLALLRFFQYARGEGNPFYLPRARADPKEARVTQPHIAGCRFPGPLSSFIH